MTENEQKLVDRIKAQLGGDVVKIEISDNRIYELMQQALETVSPYIPDTRYLTIPFHASYDMTEHDCEEVLRVMPGSQLVNQYGVGEEFMFEFSRFTTVDQFRKRNIMSRAATAMYPDVNVPFDYDRTTHMLYMTPGITTSQVTVEYIPKVTNIDNLQEQATVKWVYLYTLALTKEVIGRIRSKAKSSAVPIELDGDTLLQEAREEKEKLEASLIEDSLGPVNYIR